MGVPTSEVGYTSAMPRKEDHESPQGHMVALEKIYGNRKKTSELSRYLRAQSNLVRINFVGEVLALYV